MYIYILNHYFKTVGFIIVMLHVLQTCERIHRTYDTLTK